MYTCTNIWWFVTWKRKWRNGHKLQLVAFLGVCGSDRSDWKHGNLFVFVFLSIDPSKSSMEAEGEQCLWEANSTLYSKALARNILTEDPLEFQWVLDNLIWHLRWVDTQLLQDLDGISIVLFEESQQDVRSIDGVGIQLLGLFHLSSCVKLSTENVGRCLKENRRNWQ